MARPKTNPDTPKAPKNHVEAVEQGLIDVSDIPETREDDPTMTQKIDFAEGALERKRKALSEVGDVRELLTLLISTGSGSRDQVAWTRFNLPRKTRKTESGEEVVEEE